MSKSIYEEATDKTIITKQVIINTPTSAHLLPITADEKVIDEIQQALNELERLKKQEKLLELYKELIIELDLELEEFERFGDKAKNPALDKLRIKNTNFVFEGKAPKLFKQIKELENE